MKKIFQIWIFFPEEVAGELEIDFNFDNVVNNDDIPNRSNKAKVSTGGRKQKKN